MAETRIFLRDDTERNLEFVREYVRIPELTKHYSLSYSEESTGFHTGYAYHRPQLKKVDEKSFLEQLVEPELQLAVKSRGRFDRYDKITLFVKDKKAATDKTFGVMEGCMHMPYTPENEQAVNALVYRFFNKNIGELK